MRFADSQLHLCPAHTPETPWPDWAIQYQAKGWYPTSIEQLIAGMDGAGVERGYVHVPTWFCNRDDYALRAAEEHPDRFRVMIRPVLNDPGSEERIRRLATRKEVKGIRAVFQDKSFGDASALRWLTDGTSEWLFRLAEELELPMMLLATGQNEAVGKIAARYPNLKIMLDHMNCRGHLAPSHGGIEYIDRDLDTLMPLAEHRNVGIKVKAWHWQLHADEYPFPSVRPMLERVIKGFGAERCFWMGDFTDFPEFTYSQLIGLFLEMPALSQEEKELVMGQSAVNWLGWD